jgi:hypothetical protein
VQYFLYLRIVGLCAEVALRTQERGEDCPCVVHHEGAVYDTNAIALKRHVTLGMPLKEAKVILQGDGAFLEYKPEQFETARDSLLTPCLMFSDGIQAGLAGEGLVDLSGHPQPLDIASLLLSQIHHDIKFPIIAGIAPSVWLARKAATVCDPRALGLGILPIEPILDPAAWLASQPVSILTPIDTNHRKKLRDLGFDRVSQVQKTPLHRLEQQFPKQGALIMQTALGKLSDPIKPNYPAKMVAEELNLGNTESQIEIDQAFKTISQTLAERLCRADEQAKTVVLTAVFESGERRSQRKNLSKPVIGATSLTIAIGQLFQAIKASEPIESIRVQLLDLSPSNRRQIPLALGMSDDGAKDHIATTLNQISAAHGSGAVQVASSLTLSFNKQVLREWKRVTNWR